ncbi:hypothetical protein [Kitasatospora azatica]|uniref:hypothetical protein n=1 Tax=Kitasatospora azatica TaxID=58347 RepID=UPI000566F7E9|nr:hypothetical protein [Kitasatospora azatica]
MDIIISTSTDIASQAGLPGRTLRRQPQFRADQGDPNDMSPLGLLLLLLPLLSVALIAIGLAMKAKQRRLRQRAEAAAQAQVQQGYYGYQQQQPPDAQRPF